MLYGGGRGIRTPAAVSRPNRFRGDPLQPDLGIPPDKKNVAEEKGFEPSRRFPDLLAFQASPFGHLGIPPSQKELYKRDL